MAFSADTRSATIWTYYINEQSEYNSADESGGDVPLKKDDTRLGVVGAKPYVREWPTSWTQTVEGCPVEYIIYVEQTDVDGNVSDVDTNGLAIPDVTGINYSDVINYDATTIT